MTPGRGVPIGQRPTSIGRIPVRAAEVDEVVAASPLDVIPASHPHVWVLDEQGGQCPGLVIEQVRRDDGAWLAHVVMLTSRGPGVRVTQQGWMRADRLRRA